MREALVRGTSNKHGLHVFLYMDVSTIIKTLEMLNRREIEEARKGGRIYDL